jgi:Tfp pilus assembly protein PilN
MRRDIELDFLAVEPRVPRAGLALLAAGALCAALAGWRFAALQEETRRLEARIDSLRAGRHERVQARDGRSAAPEVAADLSRARTVARRLAAPWDELFAEVEAAVGPDVALLAIQPDLANARIALTGEARSIGHGLAFAARLNRGAALGEALLTAHEVRVQDPQRPVRFTLEARWRAAEPSR